MMGFSLHILKLTKANISLSRTGRSAVCNQSGKNGSSGSSFIPVSRRRMDRRGRNECRSKCEWREEGLYPEQKEYGEAE